MRTRFLLVPIFTVFALLLLVAGLVLADGDDGDNAAASPTPVETPLPSTSAPSTPVPSPSPQPATPTPAQAVATPAPQPVEPTPTSTLPGSDLPSLPADRQRVAAPIDGRELQVLESFPPQYVLHIQAGLPSGCAQAAGHEATRAGGSIEVSIFNSMPVADVICTAIYGMYDLNIPLGSDF